MKPIILFLVILLFGARGQSVTLNFDDGVNGNAIGSAYSSFGITFANAQWGYLNQLPNMGVYSISGGLQPTAATAIVATFATPVSFVSVEGIDAGENGIRIDAYNAVSDGSLIGSDQAFGIGNGTTNPIVISVSAPSIYRIEFYQPQNIGGDNVGFDNLTFSSVPEPCTSALFALGCFVFLRRSRLARE